MRWFPREGCYEDLFTDVERYPAVAEQKKVTLQWLCAPIYSFVFCCV